MMLFFVDCPTIHIAYLLAWASNVLVLPLCPTASCALLRIFASGDAGVFDCSRQLARCLAVCLDVLFFMSKPERKWRFTIDENSNVTSTLHIYRHSKMLNVSNDNLERKEHSCACASPPFSIPRRATPDPPTTTCMCVPSFPLHIHRASKPSD